MTLIEAWRQVRAYPSGKRGGADEHATAYSLSRPRGPAEDAWAVTEPEQITVELLGRTVEVGRYIDPSHGWPTDEPGHPVVWVPGNPVGLAGSPTRRPVDLDQAIEEGYARVLPPIAVELRAWLARCGLSQIDAARLLEPDELTFHKTISRWVTGERTPSHPNILRLALARLEQARQP